MENRLINCAIVTKKRTQIVLQRRSRHAIMIPKEKKDENEMQCYISELIEEEKLCRVIKGSGLGVELISFSISDNLDRFEDTLERVQSMLEQMGHPPVTIHGPFLDLNPAAFDSQIRKVTEQRFAQAFEAARILSADKVIYHSGMVPTVYFLEGWAEREADFWKEFLQNRSGITVCLENVLDREIEPFAEIIERVGHPDLGMCLDLGHAHCYSNHSAVEWAGVLKPYIHHVHLHDNHGVKDEHLALGEGSVPWKEVLGILADAQPDLTCTIECSCEESIRQSLQALEDFIC